MLNWLFPYACAGCGKVGTVLCGGCADGLQGWSQPREQIWSLFEYESPIAKSVVAQIKDEAVRALVSHVISRYGEHILTLAKERAVACVVPVPTSFQRKRGRGYHPSLWIAQDVAHLLELPVRTDVLERKRGKPLVGRGKSERKQAAGEQYFATDVRGALDSVLLVDDVVTSGATLERCREELVRVGAVSVTCLTLAFEK